MRRKLVLCVSTYHLTAAVWSHGQLRAVQEFSDDEGGQREFMAFLSGLRRCPIYFLADTLDEDYRFEVLPRAKGRDQAELIQRKLKQTYRNSPFCSAQLIFRDKKNAREDRYVFAALTNAEVLDPWLNLVLARRLPIVGVYLAPLTFSALVQVLGLGDRNTLAVSQHAAGLRQTFFKNGQYRVSRLTLARPDAMGPSAVNYAEEIRNTRGYLDALNITHVDEPVTILVLDQDGSLHDLDESLEQGSPNLRIVRLGPEELSRRLGVPLDILQSHRDALVLQLLGNASPSLNLAPRTVTSGYNRMRASRVIYSAAAASIAVMLLGVVINAARTGALDDEAQSFSLLTRGEDARYNEIARTFPATPATSEQLRQAVETAARLRNSYRTPDTVFELLGMALDKTPTVVLKSLMWKHEPPSAPTPVPGGVGVRGSTAQEFVQSATISAELQEYDGDQRVTIAHIDEFVRLLSSHPAVASARVTKYPVSGASNSALTGDTSVVKPDKMVAPVFEVDVTLKPGT